MNVVAKPLVAKPTINFDPAIGSKRSKTIGHINAHTRPGDTKLAARFFELLGCRIKEYGPMPGGDNFYIIEVNNQEPEEPDNVIFVGAMESPHYELDKVVCKFLGVGTDNQHPALQAFNKRRDEFPEFFLHVAIHYSSLEDLEDATVRLKDEINRNPIFGKRFQGIQVLRTPGGDPEIDARMDSSRLFSKADRDAYGPNIVQIHIRTDIISLGFGFGGTVIELDYTFRGPGRDHNPFNSLCLGAV
jgi:hypothetical protein